MLRRIPMPLRYSPPLCQRRRSRINSYWVTRPQQSPPPSSSCSRSGRCRWSGHHRSFHRPHCLRCHRIDPPPHRRTGGWAGRCHGGGRSRTRSTRAGRVATRASGQRSWGWAEPWSCSRPGPCSRGKPGPRAPPAALSGKLGFSSSWTPWTLPGRPPGPRPRRSYGARMGRSRRAGRHGTSSAGSSAPTSWRSGRPSGSGQAASGPAGSGGSARTRSRRTWASPGRASHRWSSLPKRRPWCPPTGRPPCVAPGARTAASTAPASRSPGASGSPTRPGTASAGPTWHTRRPAPAPARRPGPARPARASISFSAVDWSSSFWMAVSGGTNSCSGDGGELYKPKRISGWTLVTIPLV